MSGEEFRITVGDGKVVGLLDPGEREFHGETAVDPLRLATIDLLEQWLKRWERIAKLGGNAYERLLVPDTFRVLGTHLWELVLNNDVGTQLIEAWDRVAEDDEPLRILMSFDNSAAAKKLAELPWEFLYHPRRDIFLATDAELVLGRYVKQGSGRAVMCPKARLRVIFWVTLPNEKAFDDERAECERTRERLAALLAPDRDDKPLDVRDVIHGWHPEDVVVHLNSKADIVHIVGVCRGDQNSVELYVDKDTWVDSRVLVEALVRKPRSRPELVVLHLCDWSDSDTSENFERLAPSLVAAGIPAVIAMQYPMAPGDADRFITRFYEQLIEVHEVGRAVQEGRWAMTLQRRDRRFGAPVLYMQSADGRLLANGPLSTGEESITPTQAAVAPPAPVAPVVIGRPARPVADVLLEVVEVESPDKGTAADFARWVRGTKWPDDRNEAWKVVRSRARDHADNARVRPLYAALLRALREES